MHLCETRNIPVKDNYQNILAIFIIILSAIGILNEVSGCRIL